MKTSNAVVALDQKELETAVKNYINTHHTNPVKCVGTPKLIKTDYTFSASCEIESAPVETKTPNHPTIAYKLRHRDTKLYMRSLTFDETEKRWVIGVHQTGYYWTSLDAVFNYLEQEAKNIKNKFKSLGQDADIISLQEILLEYEIVHTGEIKAEDMTFHLDRLKKF